MVVVFFSSEGRLLLCGGRVFNWREGACVPGVRDDNVVEWSVFFAEACEADAEDHCLLPLDVGAFFARPPC